MHLEVHGDGAAVSGCQTAKHRSDCDGAGAWPETRAGQDHTLLGGGSFGRRGNPMADWVVEVSEIAKAIKGRAPVHLV